MVIELMFRASFSAVNHQPVLKEHLASRAFSSESRNEFEDLLHWITDV
jgi:hypothetical protein